MLCGLLSSCHCVIHRPEKERVAKATTKGTTKWSTTAKPKNTVPRYRAASPTLHEKLRLAESTRMTMPSTISGTPHKTRRGVNRWVEGLEGFHS
jgi:hypothetical protein